MCHRVVDLELFTGQELDLKPADYEDFLTNKSWNYARKNHRQKIHSNEILISQASVNQLFTGILRKEI